jgi:hypothetical protein
MVITPALTLPFGLGTRNGEEYGRFNGLYSNFRFITNS